MSAGGKEIIRSTLAETQADGSGLDLGFALPDDDQSIQMADLENFCEPVFSIVINGLGWFRGRRTNLRWWRRESRQEQNLDLHCVYSRLGPHQIQLLTARSCSTRSTLVIFHPVLRIQASFPNHATVATESIGIQIRFAESRINLGNIATGPTKSTIDCLYPLIGGNAGAPEDWKIDALCVSKGHPKLDGTLGVRVWRL